MKFEIILNIEDIFSIILVLLGVLVPDFAPMAAAGIACWAVPKIARFFQ